MTTSNLLFAFGVSVLLTALAYWRGYLSGSGAAAAIVVGTAILGLGGLSWAVLLGIFFVSSNLLSHFGKQRKIATAEKFEKGTRRDASQVLANGGLGSIVASLSTLAPMAAWFPFFVGIVSTVTADTWATELGTLAKRPPRLITTGKRVAVGSSGAVSPLGTAVSLAGGLLIGLAAGLLSAELPIPEAVVMGAAGGLIGSLFDSLLGATVQQVYYCHNCHEETERKIHGCGHETRRLRGWHWLNNDLVNLFSSAVGGLMTVGLWLFMH